MSTQAIPNRPARTALPGPRSSPYWRSSSADSSAPAWSPWRRAARPTRAQPRRQRPSPHPGTSPRAPATAARCWRPSPRCRSTSSNDVVSRLSAPTRALLASAAEQNAITVVAETPDTASLAGALARVGPADAAVLMSGLSPRPAPRSRAPPPERRAGSHVRHRRLSGPAGDASGGPAGAAAAQAGTEWWEDRVMAKRQAEVAFGVLGPLEVATHGRALELGSPQLRVVAGRVVGRRERRRVGRSPDPGVVGRRAAGERVELGAEVRVPVAFAARRGRRRRDHDACARVRRCTSDPRASTPHGSRARSPTRSEVRRQGDAAEAVRSPRRRTGVVAGSGVRGVRLLGVRARRGSSPRGTAVGRDRRTGRGATDHGCARGARRRARGARRRIRVSRALVGRADAGALSLGPSGGGVAGVRPGPHAVG